MSFTCSRMYTKKCSNPEGTRVKPGVGIIVIDEWERLLLERRSDNGLWGLPGGGVEPGESILETAAREVFEETGLTVRITGLVGVYSNPGAGRIVTYPDKGDCAQLVDTVLMAEVVEGELRLSPESLGLKFFSPDEIPEDLVPPAEKPIEDFLLGKRGVID